MLGLKLTYVSKRGPWKAFYPFHFPFFFNILNIVQSVINCLIKQNTPPFIPCLFHTHLHSSPNHQHHPLLWKISVHLSVLLSPKKCRKPTSLLPFQDPSHDLVWPSNLSAQILLPFPVGTRQTLQASWETYEGYLSWYTHNTHTGNWVMLDFGARRLCDDKEQLDMKIMWFTHIYRDW